MVIPKLDFKERHIAHFNVLNCDHGLRGHSELPRFAQMSLLGLFSHLGCVKGQRTMIGSCQQ